jgi:hypothetical protein
MEKRLLKRETDHDIMISHLFGSLQKRGVISFRPAGGMRAAAGRSTVCTDGGRRKGATESGSFPGKKPRGANVADFERNAAQNLSQMDMVFGIVSFLDIVKSGKKRYNKDVVGRLRSGRRSRPDNPFTV